MLKTPGADELVVGEVEDLEELQLVLRGNILKFCDGDDYVVDDYDNHSHQGPPWLHDEGR